MQILGEARSLKAEIGCPKENLSLSLSLSHTHTHTHTHHLEVRAKPLERALLMFTECREVISSEIHPLGTRKNHSWGGVSSAKPPESCAKGG